MATSEAGGRLQDAGIPSPGVVEKGDVVYTAAETLTSFPIKLEWSQQSRTKSEIYYHVIFEVLERSEHAQGDRW